MLHDSQKTSSGSMPAIWRAETMLEMLFPVGPGSVPCIIAWKAAQRGGFVHGRPVAGFVATPPTPVQGAPEWPANERM